MLQSQRRLPPLIAHACQCTATVEISGHGGSLLDIGSLSPPNIMMHAAILLPLECWPWRHPHMLENLSRDSHVKAMRPFNGSLHTPGKNIQEALVHSSQYGIRRQQLTIHVPTAFLPHGSHLPPNPTSSFKRSVSFPCAPHQLSRPIPSSNFICVPLKRGFLSKVRHMSHQVAAGCL